MLRKARAVLIGQDALEREQAVVEQLHAARARAPSSRAGSSLVAAVAATRVVAAPGPKSAVLAAEVERDLETRGALLDAVCRARLHGGRAVTAELLGRPLACAAALRRRSVTLRRLEAVAAADGRAEAHLQGLAAHEEDAEWLWKAAGDAASVERALCDVAFFRTWLLRGLNRLPTALTLWNGHRMFVAPVLGMIMPLTYVLLPVLVLRIKFGVRLPIRSYATMVAQWALGAVKGALAGGSSGLLSFALSVLIYFQGVLSSLELSGTLRRLCQLLTSRVEGAARFLGHARALEALLWTPELGAAWFEPGAAAPPDARPAWSPGTSLGGRLAAFKAFEPDRHAPCVRRAYALDALLGVARWREEAGASWARFVAGKGARKGPRLELKGAWHPSVGPDSVANDWRLGARGARHAVVTGPNAGGKSTMLRAALVSALMAQSLTVAPCRGGCALTPYAYIASHLNVPDVPGRESLFEAEMRRAKANLDVLGALPKGRFALVVMDEIFCSTNPIEGTAGALSVARHMGRQPGATCIISTHFKELCELERSTKGAFRNFQMGGDTADAKYRLRRGASQTHVALELMRARGFSDALVDEAIEIKREMEEASSAA